MQTITKTNPIYTPRATASSKPGENRVQAHEKHYHHRKKDQRQLIIHFVCGFLATASSER
jgi:hypothetical protein